MKYIPVEKVEIKDGFNNLKISEGIPLYQHIFEK